MNGTNPFSFKLFGSVGDASNNKLANEVANLLSVSLEEIVYKEFSAGEFLVHHKESVRDADVYIISQPNFGDRNQLSFDIDLCETMVYAIKQGEPYRITVVIPCLPYGRQDRSTNKQEPVLVQKVPMRLQMAGANRIITLRMHNRSSYNAHPNTIPIKDIDTNLLFIKQIKSKITDLSKVMLVAPDSGAAVSSRKLAQALGIPSNLVIVNKYRDPKSTNNAEIMEIIGNPRGFDCIIPDDMIDTCGTAVKTYQALKSMGANNIYLLAVHGILSGKAIENLNSVDFAGVWITDTCNLKLVHRSINNLEVIPSSRLLAKIIGNLHNGESITELISKWED